MAEIVFKDESFVIIGACFEVYNELKVEHAARVLKNYDAV